MPDVLLVMFALVFFVCFHRDAVRGPDPIVGLFLTIVLVVGTLTANAEPVAKLIIESMFLAAVSASLAAILAFAVLPYRDGLSGDVGVAETIKPTDLAYPLRKPVTIAVIRSLIALPLVI